MRTSHSPLLRGRPPKAAPYLGSSRTFRGVLYSLQVMMVCTSSEISCAQLFIISSLSRESFSQYRLFKNLQMSAEIKYIKLSFKFTCIYFKIGSFIQNFISDLLREQRNKARISPIYIPGRNPAPSPHLPNLHNPIL